MGYWGWKPYVPVAKRRQQAEQAVTRAKKAGADFSPVTIPGRTIAKTFWGKAWCDNLEAYSDYENRMPRGRAYVRNGSVIDLKIEPGKIGAKVMGSSLYHIEIGIAAVPAAHWKALAEDCTGSIASLVELLQGKFSKAVMERICRQKTGLFPEPKEIRLDCSCPDWATMCKHVAAVLYGVGARLDSQPELLFTLRQVNANELVARAAELPARAKKAPAKGRVLDDTALADVFGIEMAADEKPVPPGKPAARRPPPSTPSPVKAKAPVKARAPAKVKTPVKAKATAKGKTPAAKKAKAAAVPPSGKATPASAPQRATKGKTPAKPPVAKQKSRRAAPATSGRQHKGKTGSK
jgi:uncharacterized Zn finger protein